MNPSTTILALAAALGAGGQDPVQAPEAGDRPLLPVTASAEAAELWRAVAAASRAGEAAPGRTSAFWIRAEVLTREEPQTNEMTVEYRYLEPHFIRLSLRSDRETGRGPGQRYLGYWLRDGEEIVRLTSREHAEDRRLVDEMSALARNFLSLSDLASVALDRLELLEGPPEGLPRPLEREARRLRWLALSSPDFTLLERERGPDSAPLTVELGVDSATSLPALVVIRPRIRSQGSADDPGAAETPRGPGVSRLIRLGDWRTEQGFRVPHSILIHAPLRDAPATFLAKPFQEIYLLEADLRAVLRAEDFLPQ